jgi:flagellar basal-body rod protein FlgB
MGLFDATVDLLQQAAGFAMRRHAVLAQNVANVETPGYQGRDLVFARELDLAHQAQAMPVRFPASKEVDETQRAFDVRLVRAPDGPPRPDGNDVDIDRQMVKIAETALFHNAVVHLLIGKLNAMKAAISGRA